MAHAFMLPADVQNTLFTIPFFSQENTVIIRLNSNAIHPNSITA
jgi:hypothetical protein